jgi:hypothetical protein
MWYIEKPMQRPPVRNFDGARRLAGGGQPLASADT